RCGRGAVEGGAGAITGAAAGDKKAVHDAGGGRVLDQGAGEGGDGTGGPGEGQGGGGGGDRRAAREEHGVGGDGRGDVPQAVGRSHRRGQRSAGVAWGGADGRGAGG